MESTTPQNRSLKSKWSQAEFARLVGCDPMVISRHVNGGVLTRNGTAETWIRELYLYYAETAAGRSAEGISLATERAKLAKAQRIRVNFDLAIQHGKFLSVEAIAQQISVGVIVLRQKLLSLPTRVVSRLPGVDKHIFKILEEIVHECLT